jgi:cytochrome c oxidase subunit I
VGIQYLIGIGAFIFIGGLNAMLIRFELITPNQHAWNGNNYLTLVGLHGTMMMGMMSSGIIGPFANYLLPVMIGARRMAFPRVEALTFWLLMAAGVILMTAIGFGGFPTGWTGYAPLNVQANMGMDAYIAFFALVGLSMTLLGLNMIATVITMRAPGMTWGRLPIFVWGTFTTSILMLLAAPVLISVLLMVAMDRTAQTGFFNDAAGGSPYLYENLFWIFGHPEVYVLALPGMGILLEIIPVFARKPLWGYKLAVSGMLGIMLLSFLVWQHHLFVSGINADLRPFYMLSTELISLPTGFIFVAALGTLWLGRIRLAVPMLFSLAWLFNFLIGGLSGVFLSDVPSDVTTHGSFFSMAHFHYTIMGGLLFAFFAAIYFWVPKMTGYRLNERWGKVHFWTMFLAFNSTFGPLLVIGFLGMPRRAVTYAGYLQGANTWVSVSAFVLGASMLIFLANFVYSLAFARVPAGANPWGSKSIEWQLPSPIPLHNFDRIPTFAGDPYPYGVDAGTAQRPVVAPARPTP